MKDGDILGWSSAKWNIYGASNSTTIQAAMYLKFILSKTVLPHFYHLRDQMKKSQVDRECKHIF